MSAFPATARLTPNGDMGRNADIPLNCDFIEPSRNSPSSHAGSRWSILLLTISHALGQASGSASRQIGWRLGAGWEAGEAHGFDKMCTEIAAQICP